jgi:hypothetical protein
MNWFSKDIAEIVGSANVEVEIHITKSSTGQVGLAKERISTGLGAKREDIGHPITEIKEVDSESSLQIKKVDSENSSISSGSNDHVVTNEKVEEVLACGPDTFVDEIRSAVVDNVASAKGVVDYYEEAYGW